MQYSLVIRLLTTFAVALTLTGCSQPLGLEVEDRVIPVIDMHLHTGNWEDIPKIQQDTIRGFLPEPLRAFPGVAANIITSARGIRDNMNNANINWGVLLAVYSQHSTGVATNELVRDRVANYPNRFMGIASLDVEHWDDDEADQLEALENALLNYNMVGIKLAHTHMHYRLDDPRFYSVYDLAAQLDTPVYLHIGNSKAPGSISEPAYTDPAYLQEAIELYPNTKFILGHMGFDFVDSQLGNVQDCVDLAAAYPNVYLEASAIGSEFNDENGEKLAAVFERIKAAGVINKLIYGSDGPVRPGYLKDYLQKTQAAMEANDFTLDEMELVLHENFERAFATSLARHSLDPTVNYSRQTMPWPFGQSN